MKNKLITFLLVLMLIGVVITGWANQNEPVDEAPDFPGGRPIEFWVGAAAGTAQDLWCRSLAEEMKKYLDTSIVVVNKPGAGGFISFNQFMNVKPDGYTIISITLAMAGTRLNPSAPQEITWDDFALLGSMINDPGSLFIRPNDDRFHDFDSLIEYAKNNELTASITTVGSDDDLPLYYLNQKYGTKFTPVVTSGGTTQSLSDLMGGHVDLISNNIGPFVNATKEGQTKALCVYSEERYDLALEVPTFVEITGDDSFTIGNTRGVAISKDCPQPIINKMRAAFEYALEQDGLKERYKAQGMLLNHRTPEEFYQLFVKTDAMVNQYKSMLGW